MLNLCDQYQGYASVSGGFPTRTAEPFVKTDKRMQKEGFLGFKKGSLSTKSIASRSFTQNNLPHDADYDPEPDRTAEALQTWEALQVLNALIVAGGDMGRGLEQANLSVSRAEAAYAEIAEVGLSLDRKSGPGHLPALREGLLAFKNLAGLA